MSNGNTEAIHEEHGVLQQLVDEHHAAMGRCMRASFARSDHEVKYKLSDPEEWLLTVANNFLHLYKLR